MDTRLMTEAEVAALGEDQFSCDEGYFEGWHPDDQETRAANALAGPTLLFNIMGPGPHLHSTADTEHTTSDGKTVVTRWSCPIFPGLMLPSGHTRDEIIEWVTFVTQHSMSFVRAGIWMPIVDSISECENVVRYVDPPLNCAGVQAIGCTGNFVGMPGVRLSRIISTVLRDPSNPDGKQRGLLHELLHGFAHAGHNGDGIMAGPRTVRWPSENDIDRIANAFLRGDTVLNPIS